MRVPAVDSLRVDPVHVVEVPLQGEPHGHMLGVADLEHPERDIRAPKSMLVEPGDLSGDLGLPLLNEAHADSIFMEMRDFGDYEGVLWALVVIQLKAEEILCCLETKMTLFIFLTHPSQ